MDTFPKKRNMNGYMKHINKVFFISVTLLSVLKSHTSLF